MSKPEIVFKAGAVRAAIFRNVIEKAGKQIPLAKAVIEVRYRDKAGEWKGTNSLSLNEIPKAILALQKAYEYLTRPAEASSEEPGEKKPDQGADWRETFQT